MAAYKGACVDGKGEVVVGVTRKADEVLAANRTTTRQTTSDRDDGKERLGAMMTRRKIELLLVEKNEIAKETFFWQAQEKIQFD